MSDVTAPGPGVGQITGRRTADKAETGSGFLGTAVRAAFIISLILPFAVFLGSIRLPPYLAIELVLFVPLTIYWLIGKAGPIHPTDILVVIATLWAAAALAVVHGFVAEYPQRVGTFILQTFGGYLIGRCMVQNASDVRHFTRMLIVALLIMLPFGLIETATGRPAFVEIFSPLGNVNPNVAMERRMGLDRVQGGFEHPILYGVFCASALSLVYFCYKTAADGWKRTYLLPLVFVSTVISVSAGALMALMVQIGIMIWGGILRNLRTKWRLFFILCALFYIIVDIGSNRTPFEVVVSYLTFNSGSAYNRILIFEYGMEDVWRYPIWGNGYNDWTRPAWMQWEDAGSVDNFWLVNAMRYGIPMFVFVAAAFFWAVFSAGLRQGLNEEDARVRRALIITLSAIFFAICTVHLWNAIYSYLMFLVGSTIWLTRAGDGPPDNSPGGKRKRELAAASAAQAEAADGDTPPDPTAPPKRRAVIGG